jgi:nucleoid-associated protein YgaU
MNQGYVQVAPDSAGKKVVMEVITLPDGTTSYRQIAQIDGPAGDAMIESLFIQKQTLNVLRVLVAQLGGNPMDDTYMGL